MSMNVLVKSWTETVEANLQPTIAWDVHCCSDNKTISKEPTNGNLSKESLGWIEQPIGKAYFEKCKYTCRLIQRGVWRIDLDFEFFACPKNSCNSPHWHMRQCPHLSSPPAPCPGCPSVSWPPPPPWRHHPVCKHRSSLPGGRRWSTWEWSLSRNPCPCPPSLEFSPLGNPSRILGWRYLLAAVFPSCNLMV